jgi:predicted nucleic acid-binding protein
MTKLLIDTNIVIDLLAKRQPFYTDAAVLFSLADKGQLNLFVSSLTVANTHYVLSKFQDSEKARMILRRFKVLVSVLDLNDKLIDLALNDTTFKDFEDSLQYYTALENSLDVIITRNLKDFKPSKLPVMTAGEFLAR